MSQQEREAMLTEAKDVAVKALKDVASQTHINAETRVRAAELLLKAKTAYE